MSDLKLETGSGIPDADSYVSVAEADAYHKRMGNTAWSQASMEDDADSGDASASSRKNAALRKAAVFLDGYVLARVGGKRKNPAQGLLFPRLGAFDHEGKPMDGVPDAYKSAQCEAALLALTGEALTTEIPAGPRVKRRKTGELEKEWFAETYAEKPVFGWLESILAPLLGPAKETDSDGLRTITIHRG